jgi:hypothetical protein
VVVSAEAKMSEWLIWSNEHSAWWGPESCGYPRDIASAGKYTLGQAISICTSRAWMRGQVPPETMIHESCIPHMFAQITTPRESMPIDWHNDKEDGKPDRQVTTGPGDLDLAGRPLKSGS